VRILAFINISYLGLAGLNYDEYCNPRACDVPLLERVAGSAPDLVLGIKTRMGKEGVCYPGLDPLRRAVEASERTGLRVMCHISQAPPEVEEVLGLLRAGDIVTHAFTGGGERLIDADGRPRAAAQAARDRGVLFDIGHGAGSFSFASAEALAGAGFWPDTISTDLHQVSLPGPNLVADQELIADVLGDGSPQFSLLTVMTKFLYLGWGLPEVIRAVTATPASLLGMTGTIGTLRPGAQADIAILDVDPSPVELFDIHKERRRFDRSLRCVDTLIAGRPMTRVPMPATPPWIRLVEVEPASPARS
jgi:dihydroorotase